MQHNDQFGSWLRDRRKALDLTQAELAAQVGCALVTVKKIENARQRPSKQMADRLAQVLAIAPSEQAAFVAFARGASVTPPNMLTQASEIVLTPHLPSPTTPFVGRSQELGQLRQLLDSPDCRLLTLVGPGGIGKTRLALEAAHKYSATLAHGAHFVSLALVNSSDLLLFAVGNVLDFPFDGQQAPIVQLINFLSDKSLLLLLDNFEHLVDAAPLLVDLLASAPRLKLLITSRERLNLQGEWVLPIEGMDYPQNTDYPYFEKYSAIQLFVQSAQRVQPSFSLNNDAGSVLRICQLVEGLPLAIELAAAWVRLIPPSRIAERLESSIDLLASPARNAPGRHRSLRAVFDYSWGLLSADEQTALARLSVFRGGFDLEAAEQVGGASLPVVASLTDKSLLRADGTGRYALHELLRQYAADQLSHLPVEADYRERAIDYLTRAAERASGAEAHRQAAALLGQAIPIAEEIGQSALLGNLHHRRGQALLKVSLWVEARPDLEAALRATGLDNLDEYVKILLDLANVSFFEHDVVGQRQRVNEAVALAEAAQRSDLAISTLVEQGFVENNVGNPTEAVSLYERALAHGWDAHYYLGRTLYWLGGYHEALPHLRQAVESTQSDPTEQIFPLQDLGLALVATGQYAEAERAFDEAGRLSRKHEVWPLLARTLATSAGFRLDVFDFAGSEALSEEARQIARSSDFVLAEVSAGIDLLFNFARHEQPSRAEKLISEVAAAVEKASGSHGWLWRLRLAQARAELALAGGDWGETLHLTEISLRHSHERGRVKYQVLGLKTRGQALAMLGRRQEAVTDLRNALDIARAIGDPALFFHVCAALLTVQDDDSLAREAYATARRISAALPNDDLRRIFEAAEPVQVLARE